MDLIESENRDKGFSLIEKDNCEALLKRKKETLDVIQDALKNARIKIAISTINKLKTKYGEDLVHNGVNIMCNNSKQGKITAPVKYLTGILENLNNKVSGKECDNSKKLKFNNFEGREYDYVDLERKLLGWDK